MEKVHEEVVPPKSGLAIEVPLGEHLRITDLEGQQVVDIVVFNLDDLRERLSTSYSRIRYIPKAPQPYFPRDSLTEGDWLMSTLCRPMMTMVKETPTPKGVHGSHHRMCNTFFYEVFGPGPRDGCFELMTAAVAPYGISPQEIPDSVDLFMNYPHNCAEGHFTILAPVSKPGDYVEFRAEMNCLVALSNCPEDTVTACNGGKCTPVLVEKYREENYEPGPILSPSDFLHRELNRMSAQQ